LDAALSGTTGSLANFLSCVFAEGDAMRVFLAGATGVIGRRLIPLLIGAGHAVTGTTRSPEVEKVRELQAAGVKPVIVNAMDDQSWVVAMAEARPEVVIHQMTALPDVIDPAKMTEVLRENAALRIVGTANLIAAALKAGARRMIAQSIAFAYAPGPQPHAESDSIASPEGDEPSAITARGVRALEDGTLNTPGIDGIVLRYGRLYGPGTWNTPGARAPLHVDAAAHAAFLAVRRGAPGAYNIAEDDGTVTIDKARRELGFDPAFRLSA
jgi:nucleoside-diphosphate-sugar epimerase